MRRPNLWIIGIEESKDSELKGPVTIFNKIIEENFPNQKRDAHKHTRSQIDWIRKEIPPVT